MIDYDKYWDNNRDWCSCWPEVIKGIDIRRCCFEHDVDCGKRGRYNLLYAQKRFYTCLTSKGVPLYIRLAMIGATSIYLLIASPYYIYKKYKYRKEGI